MRQLVFLSGKIGKVLLLQTIVRMRQLVNLAVLLLLVATVQCWWPWGGDEEEEAADVKGQEAKEAKEEEEKGFREQLERDLAGLGQEVVFEREQSPDSTNQKEEALVEEENEEKEEKVKVTKEESGGSWRESDLSESDAANIAALLETPELARKLDRKAFEEKLDEVPSKETRSMFNVAMTQTSYSWLV